MKVIMPSVLEVMKKDTGYTVEELAGLTGMTIPSVEAEVMSFYQQGKLKVKQVGNNNFYAVKDDEENRESVTESL